MEDVLIMCNGICSRLYKAKRLYHGASMYLNSAMCSHCDRFISIEGIKQGTGRWVCKCCDRPVRWTPQGGRKTLPSGLDLTKDLNYLTISNTINAENNQIS